MVDDDPMNAEENPTSDEDRPAPATTAVTGEEPVVAVPDAASVPNRPDATDDDVTSLLASDRADSYRRRWEQIQGRFVDRPRESVEEADRLVVEVVQQLQASFTSERDRLESVWREGSDVSTEDLRVALQRYRSFFDRLLSA